MTLTMSKSESEIMFNDSQESWNGSADVVKRNKLAIYCNGPLLQ